MADPHGVDHEWIIAPPLAAAGVDLAWCERAAQAARGGGPGARPGVGGEHVFRGHAAVGHQGVEPAHLRTRRRGQVVLADGPRVGAAHQRDGRPGKHPGHAGAQAPRRCHGRARLRHRRPRDRGLCRRAQPGVDQPHRQRHRRDGRRRHAAGRDAGRGQAKSWSRSATPALACHRRWPPARSTPSTRPRTSGRAPGSVSTSPSASWWSGTAARSASIPGPARRCCASACRRGRPRIPR